MNTQLDGLQTKLDEITEQIKAQLLQIADVGTPHQFFQAETSFHAFFQQLSGDLFSFAFQQIIEHPDLRRAAIDAIHAHGRQWKSKGRRTVNITLASGTTVKVRTPYFVRNHRAKGGRKRKKRGKKGSGCYPVLLALGIKDRVTPAAIEKLARMVAICSSLNESREQLAKQGVELNIKTVRSLAWSFGKRAVEAQLKRIEQWIGQKAQSGAPLAGMRVVVTIDGGRVRLRTPTTRGRRRENGRRSFSVDWTEPRVICIYLLDEEGNKLVESEVQSCWYDAAIADADECFELLHAHLKGLGVEEAKEVVFISDGAHWMWNRVEKLWEDLGISEKVTEIVDFYHAAEHLHSVVELRKNWSKGRRKKWYEEQRRELRAGRVEQVLTAIRALAKGPKAKEYLKKCKYFELHKERMRYESFKQRKLPLGSGAVESAVRRIVNQRLKGPGIIWLEESAQAMLLFRSYLKADRWDELILMTLEYSTQLQEVA